ncbi:lipopolysaccharide biosynthesis protein [Adlercreutzia murintestinalis]|uniref:lipopolysaccharide biosynthesis protein n=1 Tax=Adlercreutzia murintestinalis TaxID=2941325 RepID=UPI00203C1FB1|nr:lipopolysaccharide biosynthesis protein [Adlercreutzia murintestinalis]
MPQHHADQPQPRQHKQNFIARLVNRWFDRVVGAMKGDGLSAAEAEYAPHRTTRDFIWNTAGQAAWAFVFPVMTMVSTQLVGVEQAGMISMAFIVALLLMFVGNFGTRAYQASDINEEHSFTDYQVSRWITCILMLVAGWLYCTLRGYQGEMFDISMGVILFKFVDALADVYEGRLQQADKLYLAGISQTLRSVVALVAFCVAMLLARSSVVACYAMAVAAIVTFVVVTWPLTLMETPKSRGFSMPSFVQLFKATAPLFVAIFLFNVIENTPKFVMEGSLAYENQLYYNALYFPAQMILIGAQLVYKPLLLRMTGVWQDASKRKKFDLLIVGLMAVIVGITAAVWLVMAWVGVPLMSFLYGVDFEPYRGLLFVMLACGGVTAAIDFLYQVITVMRRQRDVTTLYLVTFGFSLFVPVLLVAFAGLDGAVLSYLIVESILLVLLVWEYFRIRSDLARGGAGSTPEQSVAAATRSTERTVFLEQGGEDLPAEADAQTSAADADGRGAWDPERALPTPRKKRPSELRAEREHRQEVLDRRLHRKTERGERGDRRRSG